MQFCGSTKIFGGYWADNRFFDKWSLQKYEKYAVKHTFWVDMFGACGEKQYFCTVFFMVLDLRLSKDWVVGMTILLFLCLSA